MKLTEVFPDIFGIPREATVLIEGKYEPKPYQVEDAKTLNQWQNCNNFSEVGTGKSAVACMWMAAKVYQNKRVIVAMPPGLITQFQRNYCVLNSGHKLARIPDGVSARRAFLNNIRNNAPDILFMSLRILSICYRDLMDSEMYGAVVVDEAHEAANVSNANYTAIFSLARMGGMDTLMMTASPTPTEIKASYAYMKLSNPGAYVNIEHFERTHVEYTRAGAFNVISGYKDLDRLQRNLSVHTVRRRQKEVLSLADPTINNLQVELDKSHFDLYQTLLTERILEMSDDELIIARNDQSLRQMAMRLVTNLEMFTTKKFEDNPLDTLKTIVNSLNGEKVVVFCNFKATVRKLHRVFMPLNPALIYGESNTQDNVDKFLNDPTCKIALINYKSGGAGFNLQSACHYVVFFEAVGSPGQLTQALGRVHREGQKNPVVAWVMQYTYTKSKKLFKKAYERSREIRYILKDIVSIDWDS